LGIVTPPTSSADQAADALQRGDPLGADADPEEILRHLRSMPPPQPAPFNVKHQAPSQPMPEPRLVAEAQRRQQAWAETMAHQSQPMPAPPRDQVTLAMQVIHTARAIGMITATRLLLLLVLMCSAALWGLTVYDPSTNRIISSAIFTATVLWPLVGLALRKG
jgi:hypothetical protein